MAAVVLLLMVTFALSYSQPIDIHSAAVVKQAEFALQELAKLSDSGVYESLKLNRILSAEEKSGIYHDNLHLVLELASPYFKSGLSTQQIQIVVMRHKSENVTTLAVDEFPKMNEDAIEEFYIKRVEERRAARDRAFQNLEQYALDQ
jgi:hypothetical protein